MSKKVRILLVLAILVVALAVSSNILGGFASNSEKTAEGAGFQGANEAGMKIYQQSEWASYRQVPARIIEEGMAIYHQSERSSHSNKASLYDEEGMAIYRESERNSNPVKLVGSKEEGMEIYYASERNTVIPAVRLYDGKPFNAYQRSEWLGAER
jgi:hypothetical protein